VNSADNRWTPNLDDEEARTMKTLLTIVAVSILLLSMLLSIASRAMAAGEEYEKIRPEVHDNVQTVQSTLQD
jgi:hypothetical protein